MARAFEPILQILLWEVSAALRVGTGDAALQGVLAGWQRLNCGTTFGRSFFLEVLVAKCCLESPESSHFPFKRRTAQHQFDTAGS